MPLEEIHDFDNTVIAVIDTRDESEQAVSELKRAGYDVEVLRGDEGKEHLDTEGESGAGAAMKRLLNVFGDQYRILDRLTAELDAGNTVISVDAEPEEGTKAVEILQDLDAEFMWKLGSWTYSRVGD